jgi:hypothetical protein
MSMAKSILSAFGRVRPRMSIAVRRFLATWSVAA